MTRLYVSVRCERCGSYRGVDCGPYFGRQLGDEPISRGLCMSCEFEMMKMLKEKGAAETMTGIAIPYAGTVKRALREYINELEYRVETHAEDTEKAGKELECAEKALAALSGKPFGEEKNVPGGASPGRHTCAQKRFPISGQERSASRRQNDVWRVFAASKACLHACPDATSFSRKNGPERKNAETNDTMFVHFDISNNAINFDSIT